MPPQRSSAASTTSFNNRRPFKPPRPAGATSNASRSNAKGKAPAPIAISSSESDDHDDMIDRDLIEDDQDDQDEPQQKDHEFSDDDDFQAFRKNPKSQTGGTKSVASTAAKAANSSTHRTTKDRTSRSHAIDDDILEGPPPIPPKLLSRLIHDGFEDPNTKIGKEAMAVVTKYIETFVRESIARAVLERQESGEQGRSSTFLQVEDLEKLGPQLILDF